MAEGSRPDLSLHQTGRITVVLSLLKALLNEIQPARVATQWSWWRERSGPTRSLAEHGRETLQRRRYSGHQALGK